MSGRIELDFEQRRRAEEFVETVVAQPDEVAYEVIWLRDELQRVRAVVPAGASEPSEVMIEAAARAYYEEFRKRHDGVLFWESLAPGVQRGYRYDAAVAVRAALGAAAPRDAPPGDSG